MQDHVRHLDAPMEMLAAPEYWAPVIEDIIRSATEHPPTLAERMFSPRHRWCVTVDLPADNPELLQKVMAAVHQALSSSLPQYRSAADSEYGSASEWRGPEHDFTPQQYVTGGAEVGAMGGLGFALWSEHNHPIGGFLSMFCGAIGGALMGASVGAALGAVASKTDFYRLILGCDGKKTITLEAKKQSRGSTHEEGAEE